MDMDINTVNALSYEDFVNVFGNVVEKCPIVAAAVWSSRPFASFSALEAAFSEFVDALPESGKEGILRCHPDLAGRDLQRGTLTKESRDEQAGAGLDALGSAEALSMARLNREYKERFGFPFVICARMNDKKNILQQLSERCQNELAVERARGIDEISSTRCRHCSLSRLWKQLQTNMCRYGATGNHKLWKLALASGISVKRLGVTRSLNLVGK